jgi:hypothetical protein
MAKDDKKTEHSRILDRANRMLRQSRTLRKLSDELLDESNEIRAAVPKALANKSSPRKRR